MTSIPIEHTGRYRCPACPRGFHSLRAKKLHMKAEHPRKKVKNRG